MNTELDLGKAKNGIRAKQSPKEVAAVLSPMLLCCGACKRPSPPLSPCLGGIPGRGSCRAADSPTHPLHPPSGRRHSWGRGWGPAWRLARRKPVDVTRSRPSHDCSHCRRQRHLGRATGKCLITLATLIPPAWGRTKHWPDLENTYLCFQNMEQGALLRIQIQCKTNRASQTSCVKYIWVWKRYSEECHSC